MVSTIGNYDDESFSKHVIYPNLNIPMLLKPFYVFPLFANIYDSCRMFR
jgi:hypothetical protein